MAKSYKKFSRAEGDQPINLYDYNDMHWALATRTPSEEHEGEWIYEVPNNPLIPSGLGSEIFVYNYRLNETDGVYYSATELPYAPDPNFENWKFSNRMDVPASVIAWNGQEQYIAIDIPITEEIIREDPTNPDSEVVEIIRTPHYTAQYSGNAQTGFCVGNYYIATADLTAAEGYRFTEGERDETFDSRGITITIANDGKTAQVTKKWYIVNQVNRVFSEVNSEDAAQTEKYRDYEIPSFAFGSVDSVPMPYLAYGDERYFLGNEQTAGYAVSRVYEGEDSETGDPVWLRDEIIRYQDGVYTVQKEGWLNLDQPAAEADDFLTFTLKRNGETICEQANRSQWSYYLNRYMPVGEYALTLQVKHLSVNGLFMPWWLGSGEFSDAIYQGFTQNYEFSVAPAKFEIDLTGTRESIVNLADLKKNGFEKTVNDIFAPTGVQPTGGVIVTESELRANGGYWAARAEELYEFEPALAYNVSDFMSDEYYALNDDIWNAHISTEEAKTYTLFYKAVMKNYVWNVNLPEEKYENALTLQVYQELAVPVFANDGKAVYTGEEIAVVLTDQSAAYLSKFTIEPNQELLSARQDYVVTFALRDPVHYKWVGKDLGKAEIALDFVIEKAKITVPVLAHKTYNGEPLTPDEFNDIPTGADGNPIYRLDTAIPQNWINAGSYDIDLRLTDPANYEWRDVHQDPTGTPEQITIKFVIDPAQDDWKDSFRFLPW